MIYLIIVLLIVVIFLQLKMLDNFNYETEKDKFANEIREIRITGLYERIETVRQFVRAVYDKEFPEIAKKQQEEREENDRLWEENKKLESDSI